MVSEQAALVRFFQCMSKMRPEYIHLGLEFFSLEENHSHTPKKPLMVEENKNGVAEDFINLLLEKSLM